MQTKKSLPEGERPVPETRFTEFPALSVDLGMHRDRGLTICLTYHWRKRSFNKRGMMANSKRDSEFFVNCVSSRVSCLSPWTRQNFPAPLGQGPIALAVGAGGGLFGHFFLFSFFSPSLWETARYRLKYCLKGSLNPIQPTNQSSTAKNRTILVS